MPTANLMFEFKPYASRLKFYTRFSIQQQSKKCRSAKNPYQVTCYQVKGRDLTKHDQNICLILIFKLLLEGKDLEFGSDEGSCFSHINRFRELLENIIETQYVVKNSTML